MSHTDQFRSQLGQGRSRDEALAELRRAGASPMDCIKAIYEAEGVGLAEAKRLFSQSPIWADVQNCHEALAEQLEKLTSEMITPATIYVALQDEGMAVWRPVEAALVGEDTYRILSANSDYPEETWQFDHGDLVRCADRMLSGIHAKVAVARASPSV